MKSMQVLIDLQKKLLSRDLPTTPEATAPAVEAHRLDADDDVAVAADSRKFGVRQFHS